MPWYANNQIEHLPHWSEICTFSNKPVTLKRETVLWHFLKIGNTCDTWWPQNSKTTKWQKHSWHTVAVVPPFNLKDTLFKSIHLTLQGCIIIRLSHRSRSWFSVFAAMNTWTVFIVAAAYLCCCSIRPHALAERRPSPHTPGLGGSTTNTNTRPPSPPSGHHHQSPWWFSPPSPSPPTSMILMMMSVCCPFYTTQW